MDSLRNQSLLNFTIEDLLNDTVVGPLISAVHPMKIVAKDESDLRTQVICDPTQPICLLGSINVQLHPYLSPDSDDSDPPQATVRIHDFYPMDAHACLQLWHLVHT